MSTGIERVLKEIDFSSAERLAINKDLGMNGCLVSIIYALCSFFHWLLDVFLLLW